MREANQALQGVASVVDATSEDFELALKQADLAREALQDQIACAKRWMKPVKAPKEPKAKAKAASTKAS